MERNKNETQGHQGVAQALGTNRFQIFSKNLFDTFTSVQPIYQKAFLLLG
jgi:hypothetical protein